MDPERDLKLGDPGFGEVDGMGIKFSELNMGLPLKLLLALWDSDEGLSSGLLVSRKNCGGTGLEAALPASEGGMLLPRNATFSIWSLSLRL